MIVSRCRQIVGALEEVIRFPEPLHGFHLGNGFNGVLVRMLNSLSQCLRSRNSTDSLSLGGLSAAHIAENKWCLQGCSSGHDYDELGRRMKKRKVVQCTRKAAYDMYVDQLSNSIKYPMVTDMLATRCCCSLQSWILMTEVGECDIFHLS
jgi:hypothetical protein